MADFIHNFGGRKHKRGVRFKWATDATLEVIGEADQHSAGDGSKEQDSLEIGFHGQLAMETTHLVYLGEVPPTHEEVRGGGGVFPYNRLLAGRPTKAMAS